MPDSEELRARLESLERGVRDLACRVSALEVVAAAPLPPAAEPVVKALPPPAAPDELAATGPGPKPESGIVALGGRTVLALAGAYLVRALTDAGVLSPLAGVGFGFAYALAWFALMERSSASDARLSASFHGLAGALIAYPLVWETTTRLGLVTPAAALALVVGVFAAGSLVAARHHLRFVAWMVTLLALGTIAGLLVVTRELLGVVLALLAVAGLLEGLSSHGLWRDLRWPAALLLDGSVVVLVWLAGRPEGLPEDYRAVGPTAAIVATLALPVLYVVSIAALTLRLDRTVSLFEVVQGAVALALGFGGAARLVAAHQGTGWGLAMAALVLGTVCYAVAFAFVERHEGRSRNFYFYSSAGGLLALFGTKALLDTGALVLLWCALALCGCWLGSRFDRTTLRYHGAVYLCAAGLVTGLLRSTTRNLSANPAGGLVPPSAFGLSAALAAVACAIILGRDRAAYGWRRIPHGLVAAWTSWIAAGTLTAILAQVAGITAAAGVATVRTGVVAALAVILALLARRLALIELSWLVYPLLAFGGVKLVAEDVPVGNAATLFVSFVLYGAALIATPRIVHGTPSSA